MTDAITVGDRVSWQHKGETRTGTVVNVAPVWGDYLVIQMDGGNTMRIHKPRLTKLETQEVSE